VVIASSSFANLTDWLPPSFKAAAQTAATCSNSSMKSQDKFVFGCLYFTQFELHLKTN
jgi:hypothetical protein